MSWQILISINVVAVAVSTIFQRSLMRGRKISPLVFAAAFQILVGLFIGVVLLFKGMHFPAMGPIAFNLVLAPLLYSVGNASKFKALKEIDASKFIVIYQASALITVLAAVFLMKESFHVKQFLGLFLIIVAIFFATSQNRILIKLNKGELWALLTAVVYGISFVNDAYILRSFDLWTYTFLIFMIPGLAMLIFLKGRIKGAGDLFGSGNIRGFFLSGFFYALGTAALYGAYQVGRNAGQIYSVAQTSTILIVLSSAVFLKERSDLVRKFLAALLGIIGVILLK